jgi:hypothetical protein
MKKLKRYSQFYVINEAIDASSEIKKINIENKLESTKKEGTIPMVLKSASCKIGGPNYDGKGLMYMPAGQYTKDNPTKVKFTVENTSKSVGLFLNEFTMYSISYKLGVKVEGGQINFPSAYFTYSNKEWSKLTYDYDLNTAYSPWQMVINPGEKLDFFIDVNFTEKLDIPNGSLLFLFYMRANVEAGTTEYSDAGNISIGFTWNSEVSYF